MFTGCKCINLDGTDLRLQINLAMRIKSSFVTCTNIIGLDVPRCFTPFLYKSLTILKFIMGLNLQDVATPVRSVSRAISRNGQVSGQPHDVS